jgi:hypothetical protein
VKNSFFYKIFQQKNFNCPGGHYTAFYARSQTSNVLGFASQMSLMNVVVDGVIYPGLETNFQIQKLQFWRQTMADSERFSRLKPNPRY